MKKIFKLLVLVILALFIFGCNHQEEPEEVDDPNMSEAQKEAKKYNLKGTYHSVTFIDRDDTVLVAIFCQEDGKLYVEGKEVEFPSIPTREGYYGTWNYNNLTNIKRDIKNELSWTINTYSVTFVNHSLVVQTMNVNYGTVLDENSLPKLNTEYGDVSTRWDIELPYTVKSNLRVVALHEYMTFASEDNAEFESFLDELFYEELGTEPLSINFNLYHPENFNKEGVFNFDECIFDGYDFSEEGEAEYYTELKKLIAKIEAFDDSSLSKRQYLDKIIILDNYKKSAAFEGYQYYGTLLGSYLGYQAQLPSTLAEYGFRHEKDITDYFSYLEYTQDIFENIVAFENKKAELGQPLTDAIINRVIEQCDNFINGAADEENPIFLIPTFDEKVDALTFIDDAKKTEYKARNKKLVNENFVQAYVYLKAELEKMLGNEEKITMEDGSKYMGSFAQMENGKEYYQAKLQNALGTSQTVDEVYEYLGGLLGKNMGIYSNNRSQYLIISKTGNFMKDAGLEKSTLLDFLRNAIVDDFPELNVELDMKISDVPEALRENSSPAYYFISPIDDNLTESIYVNPANKDLALPSNYMYTTIAHEGYPGHLYQNVYMKNCEDIPNVRKLISYSCYAEGWAVHVENYVLKYLLTDEYLAAHKAQFGNLTAEQLCEISLKCDSLTYLIIGMLDIGVNYYGWDLKEADNFLSSYFSLTQEELLDLYYDVTEIPTNYLMYYYSVFRLEDMKTNFKKIMGDKYSDKLFHQIVLETGACPWDVLEYRLNDYAEHANGLK